MQNELENFDHESFIRLAEPYKFRLGDNNWLTKHCTVLDG